MSAKTDRPSKIVLVILKGDCYQTAHDQLIDAGFQTTEFSSIGGFFRQNSKTLLIGVDANQVDAALDILRATCPTPPGSDYHGATIFVLDAASFHHI